MLLSADNRSPVLLNRIVILLNPSLFRNSVSLTADQSVLTSAVAWVRRPTGMR